MPGSSSHSTSGSFSSSRLGAGAIVTVEENVKAGGFGAAVLELLTSRDVLVPTRVLAVPDRVFEQASQGRLRELAGLTPAHIAAAARNWSGSSKAAFQDSSRIGPAGRLDSAAVRVSLGGPPGRHSTREVIVNPVGGASSLSAEAATDTATTLFPPHVDWSGLADASGRLGVSLDADALERFARYRALLLERSAQFNLTAIRDPEEIERRLFLDAIAMIPELDRRTGHPSDQADRAVRLVDVGAGAGFPGLALKIVRPTLDVTLIDATAKKVTFVNEVIAALELRHVRAVQGRAEELGQDHRYRARFDVATARGVASLPVLLEYVVPFLTVGGTALLPKGLEITEELRLGQRAAAILGAEIVSAEELPLRRTRLVVAGKISPTAASYPRRVGIPSREPLGERA